jgi:hypothetical protein
MRKCFYAYLTPIFPPSLRSLCWHKTTTTEGWQHIFLLPGDWNLQSRSQDVTFFRIGCHYNQEILLRMTELHITIFPEWLSKIVFISRQKNIFAIIYLIMYHIVSYRIISYHIILYCLKNTKIRAACGIINAWQSSQNRHNFYNKGKCSHRVVYLVFYFMIWEL